MNKFYAVLLLLCSFYGKAQNIEFAGSEFKAALLQIDPDEPTIFYTAKDAEGNDIAVDTDGNGEITIQEALTVYELNLLPTYQWEDLPSPDFYDMGGIENFTNLTVLRCGGHSIINIDISTLTNLVELDCSSMALFELDLTGLSSLKILRCSSNMLSELNVNALPLEVLYCENNNFPSINLTGLTSLKELNISGSQYLTGLNLQDLSNLEELSCYSSPLLTNLDLTGLTGLKKLYCGECHLTSLSLEGAPNLETIDCWNNEITEINFAGAPHLTSLTCFQNPLTTLDLSFPNHITYLMSAECTLTSVDLSGCADLYNVILYDNQLTSIDVSNSSGLNYFSASSNDLEYLNLKNGSTEEMVSLYYNQNLAYICVDGAEQAMIQTVINDPLNNYTNCVVNSYCSFTPGGETFEVSGTVSLDENTNGCDSNDTKVPDLVIHITDETGTGTYIGNNTGNYTLNMPFASLTMTAVNPNPQYYSIEPQTVTIAISDESPYIQNFCLTPLGNFNDLEIIIVPVTAARPGFNALYRLIYKNKGTATTGISIQVNYNDDILNYLSASLEPDTNNGGTLIWEVPELHPFEEGIIYFTLKVNSPVESPPVNAGDILALEASVIMPDGDIDQTPLDNIFLLDQTVMGSMDPNDKTCLEGDRISPEMAGEYVHYLICFENTGNYFAENIVVVDMIDIEKFDINTLTPLHGSHPYVTRINSNKVEFIFENIQLPGMPDENRHGYVAFKIKTLETLQLDDTFSNTAAIYFDHNAPVLTDPAVTTLALPLANPDFDLDNHITLYPNPAALTLYLDLKGDISLRSVEIFNTLGQVMIALPNASGKNDIDVSMLAAGTYFIKATTDKGASYKQFVKE